MLPQTETEFELGVAIRSGTIHDLSAALESAEEYLQDQQMAQFMAQRLPLLVAAAGAGGGGLVSLGFRVLSE